MYAVTSAEMQTLDRLTIDEFGLPGRLLMENAGREATRVFLAHFADRARQGVGVIAGRGNNGGDGYVIARCLAHKGFPVRVYLLSTVDRIQGDAAVNLNLLAAAGVPVIEAPDEAAFGRCLPEMREAAVWVDTIFGTGLHSEVGGVFRQAIEFINQLNRPVLAVDIPSGLDADTGQSCGACIRASVTATFAYPKVGQLVFPGVDVTGRLEVVDIGIPPAIADRARPRQHLLSADIVRGYVGRRPADAHKGRTGHLLVVAGSPGKTGAAAMTAASALRIGAGLVTLGTAASLHAIMETLTLEVMTTSLPESAPGILGPAAKDAILELAQGKACLALGPGLGPAPETGAWLGALVGSSPIPMVIDADGLNYFAGATEALRNLPVATVLTPHPGEMARLLGTTASAVQRDRVACARDLAVGLNLHVVLKGARTLIAHPDGTVWINPTGNSGMASGGMGDVLTGALAGLIAQGLRPELAARAAVYLHGAAADHLARRVGPWGYLASEVMNALPAQIAALIAEG
jgi:NAD(P)H-hydrate epimerase